MIGSVADRLTIDAIKSFIRFAWVTPAAITQTLFGDGVKPQEKNNLENW